MRRRFSPFFQILIFASVSSGFLYGYNSGIYSGVMLQIQQAFGLADADIADLIALFDFAEIAGVSLCPLADRFGRRRTLLVSASVLVVAPLLLLLEPPFGVLLLERGLTGCAAGFTFMIGLVYVAEIAPPAQRALLLSFLTVSISGGYVAELGLSIVFVAGEGWRLAIALAAVPAFLQLLGLVWMRESPVFLRLAGNAVEARAAATWYGFDDDEDAGRPSAPALGARAIPLALREPQFRRRLWLGLLVVFAGTTTGAGIIPYGPMMMKFFGLADPSRALEILVIYTVLGLLVGLLALIAISRGHTKTILVASLLLMSASLFIIPMIGGLWGIGLFGVIQLAFSFGIRTTVFQIMPVLLTDETRAVGMAFFSVVFLLLTGLNIELIPRVLNALPNGLFILYGALALLLAVLCRLALPGLKPGTDPASISTP